MKDRVTVDLNQYDQSISWSIEEEQMYAEDAARAAREKAEEMICTKEGLLKLDEYSQFTADSHYYLARAFTNLSAAFRGERVGIDACLQALLCLRNRCYDDAMDMLGEQ